MGCKVCYLGLRLTRMQQPLAVFLDHFSGLEDSRETGKVLHPVPEILLVTLCGVIAGAEGFEDIEDYGESKLDLLRELLPFANGIPSDDTLRRFFRAVDPRAFAEVFVAFARDVFPEAAQRLIAIDGKTLRRSHDGTAKALHLAGQPHEILRIRLRVGLSHPAFFLNRFMDSRGCLAACSRLRA